MVKSDQPCQSTDLMPSVMVIRHGSLSNSPSILSKRISIRSNHSTSQKWDHLGVYFADFQDQTHTITTSVLPIEETPIPAAPSPFKVISLACRSLSTLHETTFHLLYFVKWIHRSCMLHGAVMYLLLHEAGRASLLPRSISHILYIFHDTNSLYYNYTLE